MCVGWLKAVVCLSFATVSGQLSLVLTQKGCFPKTDNDGTNTKPGLSITWLGMTMDTPTSQLKESTFGQRQLLSALILIFCMSPKLLSQFFPPSSSNMNDSGHSVAFPICISMTSLMGFHLFLNAYQGDIQTDIRQHHSVPFISQWMTQKISHCSELRPETPLDSSLPRSLYLLPVIHSQWPRGRDHPQRLIDIALFVLCQDLWTFHHAPLIFPKKESDIFIHIYLWVAETRLELSLWKLWSQRVYQLDLLSSTIQLLNFTLPHFTLGLRLPFAMEVDNLICKDHWETLDTIPTLGQLERFCSLSWWSLLYSSCSQGSRIFLHICHNISHCNSQLVFVYCVSTGPWEDWSLTHLFMRVSTGWRVPSAALCRPKPFPHRGPTPNSGTIYFLFLSTLSIIICFWIIYGVQKAVQDWRVSQLWAETDTVLWKLRPLAKWYLNYFFPRGRQPTFSPLNVLFMNFEFQSIDGDSDAVDNWLI